MTPSGPKEVMSLPTHINEATAARNSGARPAGLFGTSNAAHGSGQGAGAPSLKPV